MNTRFLLSLALAAMGLSVRAESGWIMTESATGTFEFLEAENWYGGEINGYFGEDVKVQKDYVLSFTGDWVGAFRIYGQPLYSDAKLVFLSDARTGPFTVTLNDDIEFLSGGEKGSVVFGKSDNAKQALNLDLGGVERRITMRTGSAPSYLFYNTIRNGALNLVGGGGTLSLRVAGCIDGDVKVGRGVLLEVQGANKDTVRTGDVTLGDSTLAFKAPAASETETIGRLIVDGEGGRRGEGLLTIATNKTAATTVRMDAIERRNHGILVVNADNLGGAADADALASRVYVERAPENARGVVKGVLAATSATANVIGADYTQGLAYWDSETKELRRLETADMVSSLTGEDENLLVPAATTLEVSGEASVNALVLQGGDGLTAETVISGTEPLKVTSGQVYMQYNRAKAPRVAVPLDFGDATGYFYYGAGKNSYLDGAVAGSAGLVLVSVAALNGAESGTLIVNNSATGSTYTGDTFVWNGLTVGASTFLPHGNRSGDVYLLGAYSKLSGHWEKLNTPTFVINGLYGEGEVGGAYSSSHYFRLGDNDADGDFAGTVSVQTVYKTGKGTQRFSGSLTGDGNKNGNPTLQIDEGAVVLDGSVPNGYVVVKSGAAIGGGGTIAQKLTLETGAVLAVEAADGAAAALTVGGAVTGSGVKVRVTESGAKWKEPVCILRSDTPIEATFERGSDNIGQISFNDDRTEVWATPKKNGLVLIIR